MFFFRIQSYYNFSRRHSTNIYAFLNGPQTCYTTVKGLQQLLHKDKKFCKSALKDYFDEKDALDEYVIAKLTRQVYKLEQLPGGSKIRTLQKKMRGSDPNY